MRSYLLLFTFSLLVGCQGFRLPFVIQQSMSSRSRQCSTCLSLSNRPDDESNHNNNNHDRSQAKNDYWNSLSSYFPPETPSGLRGEAIIRALQSGRTVVYQPPLQPQKARSFMVRGAGTERFLNQKLSQRIQSSEQSWYRGAILNRRGHVLDMVGVACVNATFAVVFPTHLDLEEHWGPTIFPLDQVTVESSLLQCISVFSIRHWHVQSLWEQCLRRDGQPKLLSRTKTLYVPPDTASSVPSSSPRVILTTPGSIWWPPHTVAASYTMLVSGEAPLTECLFQDNDSEDDDSSSSPLWVGEREYQAMRIAAGQPAFGELPWLASAPPVATVLEWELSSLVDFEKGCYLGQERVAAQSNNPLPQSLYQIEFLEDENNDFTTLQKGWPTVNDTVYVLGSNEALIAGKLIEVAEPACQNTPSMLGLVLVKRANSLLKRMEQLELDLPSSTTTPSREDVSRSTSSTRDKLDGLEVIVNGELIGHLRTLPYKLLEPDTYWIDDLEQAPDQTVVEEKTELVAPLESKTSDETEESMTAPTKIESQAERERKEAKIEMLRKRAEEALARRQQRKSSS